MASHGHSPSSSRSKHATQHTPQTSPARRARRAPTTDTSTGSPLSRFASPLSAASNFSFSPPSAGFLSLSGAAATTPLSSTDGDVDCPPSPRSRTTADDRDQLQHSLVIDSSIGNNGSNANTSRSRKIEVAPALSRLPAHSVHSMGHTPSSGPSAPCPVDAVAPSATNTAKMTTPIAQSTTPIRGSGTTSMTDRSNTDNTRVSKKSNSGRSDATGITRGNIANFPKESYPSSSFPYTSTSTTSTTSTPSWPSQPITSDLIRRVSSSRSIANSARNPSLSLSIPLSSSQVLRPAPTLITTNIVSPKATRPASSPLQQQLPAFSPLPPSNSNTLCSSVAQLEETAEHFANTGSIEIAIREAHQELKRSDSRRSSILAASVRQATSRAASQNVSRAASVLQSSEPTSPNTNTFTHPADLFSISRRSSLARSRRDYSKQSSIFGLNSAARAGALTSTDYIMSPTASIVGANKANSAGEASSPVLSRHGTGKGSVRSMQSGKQSLAEIVEHGPPTAITQDALDEADRRSAKGEDHEDDDTIRANAHQHIGEDNYDDEMHPENYAFSSSPGTDSGLLSTQTAPPVARPSVTDYLGFSSAQQYQPVATTYPEYEPSSQVPAETEIDRPATSGSGGTFQQAQTAFHDFDGVHCDPDNASIKQSVSQQAPGQPPQPPLDLTRTPSPGYKPRVHAATAARPTSYMDPSTGQQMLFYPARVPAMLNLPPKLSKNPKAAERNARRSQVLSMMVQNNEPKHERESRMWLPDPISGDMGSPLMDTTGTSETSPAATGLGDELQSAPKLPLAIDPDVAADADSGPKTGSTVRGENSTSQLRRPARIADADKRKSRMSTLSKLPPQLRASAFFDSPSATANIQLKDGSATATLDSILDASASAPVSAFTDHAFAGHLGSEVYGVEKRRPKKASANGNARKTVAIPEPAPLRELRTSKSRSSFMSIVGLGHVRRLSEPMDGDERRPRRRLSKNFDGAMLSPGLSDGGNLMAPDDDERASDGEEDGLRGREDGEEEDGSESDEDEDEDEDDGLAYGAPTTLLAELQIRKRQQKLRTRPINQAFPNGMHSTLLELDTVAEIERNARKGKRVNLAWEDPSLANGDGSDDEDVPLGMLFAARTAGHNDISAVAAEMNRPLGLMEKKEMEDNEPLSRRRDRLQGRDAGAGMYLRPSQSTNALRRQSMLTMTPSMSGLNKAYSLSPHASHRHSAVGPDDIDNAGTSTPPVEELDDEPLAARKLRMKAKEESQLPRARPVSMAFSEELLGQFADPDQEQKEEEQKDKLAKANAAPHASEEEETLAQRRRRLQAEKEARQQEMNGIAGGLSYSFGPGPVISTVNNEAPSRLTRRLSMADVLAAHPLGSAQGAQNPREIERIRREQEAARAASERGQKMAAMRAQMPQGSGNAFGGGTGLVGGLNKSGGFLGGRFNDGSGGVSMMPMQAQPMGSTLNLHAPMANMGNPIYGGYGGMSQPNLMMPNTAYSGYNGMQIPSQQMQMQQMQMQMQQMQMQMNMGMGMGGQTPMQMPVPGQPQIERVERWRQSIQP